MKPWGSQGWLDPVWILDIALTWCVFPVQAPYHSSGVHLLLIWSKAILLSEWGPISTLQHTAGWIVWAFCPHWPFQQPQSPVISSGGTLRGCMFQHATTVLSKPWSTTHLNTTTNALIFGTIAPTSHCLILGHSPILLFHTMQCLNSNLFHLYTIMLQSLSFSDCN